MQEEFDGLGVKGEGGDAALQSAKPNPKNWETENRNPPRTASRKRIKGEKKKIEKKIKSNIEQALRNPRKF